MKKTSLASFPWKAILTEFLYMRVPRDKLREVKLSTYEAASAEYLATYPEAVAAAVAAAEAEYGEFADSEHVTAKLRPPFLAWAREVKKFELMDSAAGSY